jgi:hypothetical protein
MDSPLDMVYACPVVRALVRELGFAVTVGARNQDRTREREFVPIALCLLADTT